MSATLRPLGPLGGLGISPLIYAVSALDKINGITTPHGPSAAAPTRAGVLTAQQQQKRPGCVRFVACTSACIVGGMRM